MRAAYLLHGRFPTERAHGLQIAKLCEALGERVELTLFALAVSRIDPFVLYGVRPTFRVERLRAFPSHLRKTKLGFLLEKILFSMRAAAWARNSGATLLITREPFALVFWRGASVLELHDVPAHLGLYVPLLRRASAIIAKTSFVKRALASRGIPKERITVLPNAVDLSEFRSLPLAAVTRAKFELPEGPLALYAGSLQAWKGVRTLLEAGRMLQGFTVVVVGGKTSEIEVLKKEFSQARFLGQQPRSEIPALLAAANVLVLPNAKGTKLAEEYTSPLKLFEYAAARRPVVASRLPAIEELVSEKEVYLFKADDPADCARAIKEALAHPTEAHKKTERAFAKLATRTWAAYAEELLGLVQ